MRLERVRCVHQAAWRGPTWDREDVMLSGTVCVCNVLKLESLERGAVLNEVEEMLLNP